MTINHKNRIGWAATIVGSLAFGAAAFGVNTLLGSPINAFASDAATVAETSENQDVATDKVVDVVEDEAVEAVIAEPVEITEDLQWFKDLAEYDRDWVCTFFTVSGENITARVGDNITLPAGNTRHDGTYNSGAQPQTFTIVGTTPEEMQTIINTFYNVARCHNSLGVEVELTPWDYINRTAPSNTPPLSQEEIERLGSRVHHSELFPEIWP